MKKYLCPDLCANSANNCVQATDLKNWPTRTKYDKSSSVGAFHTFNMMRGQRKKLAELPRQQLMCACGPIQEQPVDRALVTTGKPTHRCILIKRGDVGFQRFLGHVWVDFERK